MSRVTILSQILVGLVALLHLYFLVLEMFLWTTPSGRATFGTTAEFAEESKGLAANQGLYNGFLVAGLVWGLVDDQTDVLVFFLVLRHRRRSLRRGDGEQAHPRRPGGPGRARPGRSAGGCMTRRGWSLFLAMCLIWGLPYLFIRIAVESVDPGTLVFVRTALAALVLLPIALARREVRPVLARWKPLAALRRRRDHGPVAAARPCRAADLLVADRAAGRRGPAVRGAGLPADRPAPRGSPDAQLGRAGARLRRRRVAWSASTSATSTLLPIVEVLGVAVCYAAGPLILSRWLSDLPGLGVMACALTLTTIVFAPYGARRSRSTAYRPRRGGASSVLALVCTALAFVLFFLLIAEVGPDPRDGDHLRQPGGRAWPSACCSSTRRSPRGCWSASR